MKKFKPLSSLLVFLFLTLFLFNSCTQEQTSFSIDDIQGRAIIKGKLTYSEGQKYINGRYSEKLSPAAGRKIYAEVSNYSLSPNGNANGYTTFETTVDDEGNYVFELPVVASNYYGTEVYIKAEDFTGKQLFLKSMENGKPIFEEKDVIYKLRRETQNIRPNDVIIADMRYSAVERDSEFNEIAALRLLVGIGKLYYEEYYYGWGEVKPYFDFKEGISALFTVTYTDTYPYYTRRYMGVSNSKGEILLDIPTKEERTYLNIEVELNPFREEEFFYPLNESDCLTYTGTYRLYERWYGFTDYKDYGHIYFTNSSRYTTIEVRMVLEPDYGQDSYYDPSWIDWYYPSLEN